MSRECSEKVRVPFSAHQPRLTKGVHGWPLDSIGRGLLKSISHARLRILARESPCLYQGRYRPARSNSSTVPSAGNIDVAQKSSQVSSRDHQKLAMVSSKKRHAKIALSLRPRRLKSLLRSRRDSYHRVVKQEPSIQPVGSAV